ncbi:MAG: linear amide C-N hydrolase [Oscillospiraceae bacterium]|nr:linear amide C-N hydrolase [Oscillospiraceae bacterium]
MKIIKFGLIALVITAILAGCADAAEHNSGNSDLNTPSASDFSQTTSERSSSDKNNVPNTENGKSIEIMELEKGLSHTRYSGDYKFEKFLSEGGAESDNEVIAFLAENLIGNALLSFGANNFGCSAFSAKGGNGYYFGRNFDWYNCNALIVEAYPENAYSSISTVNIDFIGLGANMLSDQILTLAAIYAPIDGMNEKGLCVSVNMVEDNESVNQKTSKPDITTTTAVRLLLDKAATVDEAIALLKQYDMHASKGLTVHFAVADANGKCVAVEYLNSEMIVTETPVVTNFYFAEGPKNGKGTQQSHERYEKLMRTISEKASFTANDVMSALESVSKHNYHDGETTEWSAVFNQSTGEAIYCHRENYSKRYTFNINR